MKNEKIWIVALDFSKMDLTILNYTKYLSSIFQPKKIHFINVIKEVEIFTYLSGEYLGYSNQLVVDQQLILKHKVEQYFKDSEIPYECHIKSGVPFDEVIDLVFTQKASLVLAGRKTVSKGHGIVSDRLSRNLPCDFLIVPEGYEPMLNKVLVLTDFSEHSSLAMQRAMELGAINTKADIMALNSYSVPMGYSKSGKSYEEFAEIMRSNAEKEMNRWLKKFDYDIKPVLVLKKDDPLEKEVLEIVQENEINLIVVGSKGQTKASLALLGSTTMKLLKSNDQVPLLIAKKPGENLSFLDALKRI